MRKLYLKNFTTLLFVLAGIYPIQLMAAGLIVNEASNGTSGSKEFYEFIVVGDSANPTSPVNLDQWILDDNNGDWGGGGSGLGTAPGYARFDTQTDTVNCSALGSVAPGSIIVVYNDGDPNLNVPADDTTDANGDGVYILPATGSCIRTCAGPPSSSDNGYSACSTAATPSYSPLAFRNGGDVAQSRDAGGNLFHGFTYGDVPTPYPTNSFKISGSGTGSTFLFSCGSWYDGSNFSKAAATTDTPGSTNDALNVIFRTNIQTGAFDYSDLTNPANCVVSASPDISLHKTVLTYQDPLNGTSSPKAIPGALAEYTITATNSGNLAADEDSIVISDIIPANTALYVNDIAGMGSGPIVFVNGSPDSGLSAGSVSYFNASNVSISPSPDTDGVDTNVASFRITTLGQFLGSSGSGNPNFKILFRVRVQ